MVKSRRNMKGGMLNADQTNYLKGLEFTDGQIGRINEFNITYEQVQKIINEYNELENPEVDLPDYVDHKIIADNMNNAENVVQNAENEDNDYQDEGPLNMSDLSIGSRNSGYTTEETRALNETGSFGEFGGKKRRRKTMRKNKKYSKSRKTRKSRKHKRKYTYKQRGGTCYGNGIGANNYDPNFSIYNTRELQLFPYRPTN